MRAAAPLPEQVIGRHHAVLEHHAVGVRGVPAHLAVRRFDGETGRVRRHDDGGDLLRSRAGGNDDEARDRRARVGDERLGPVQDPLLAAGAVAVLGAGRGGEYVRTPVGFGQPEGGECASGRQIGQPALLLGFAAVAVDRLGAQQRRSLEGDAERLIRPTDLLDGQAERREVGARAAPALVDEQPEEPQPTHLENHVGGEGVLAVPCLGVGCDALTGELANHLPELLLLGCEFHRAVLRRAQWWWRRADPAPRWPPHASGTSGSSRSWSWGSPG